jgi:hypothetical protein
MATLTITDAGLNLLRDGVKGGNNPKVTYVAIGTSGTTPATTDTKLGAEVYRKKVDSYSNGASAGEILVSAYLNASEAVGVVIAEVGFFGGNSAGSAANSGVLVGRGLYSHTKVGTEGIQLQMDLTI